MPVSAALAFVLRMTQIYTLVLWIALLSGLLSFNVVTAIKSEFETETLI